MMNCRGAKDADKGAEINHRHCGQISLTGHTPRIIAFAIGLFHGPGFAGTLTEIGGRAAGIAQKIKATPSDPVRVGILGVKFQL